MRAIKLPASLLDLFRQYHVWQTAERLKVGDQWRDEGWVFTQPNGQPCHPDSLPKKLKNFLARNGLPDTIHIHSLRHSNASFMIASGVDLRTVSKRLGHAQMSTTGNIYAHQIKSADEAAAEALDMLTANKKRPFSY
jgi:site-specific recombinase XerD